MPPGFAGASMSGLASNIMRRNTTALLEDLRRGDEGQILFVEEPRAAFGMPPCDANTTDAWMVGEYRHITH
jgi:hypothetical protein